MKLFELLDFHFKYGRGGAVKLKLRRGPNEFEDVLFDGDSENLIRYTQFLDVKVIKNEADPIGPAGFYRLIVTLDYK